MTFETFKAFETFVKAMPRLERGIRFYYTCFRDHLGSRVCSFFDIGQPARVWRDGDSGLARKGEGRAQLVKKPTQNVDPYSQQGRAD